MTTTALKSDSVRSGDTLSGIAKKFGVSLDGLLDANPDKFTELLHDPILIPLETSALSTVPPSDTTSISAARFGSVGFYTGHDHLEKAAPDVQSTLEVSLRDHPGTRRPDAHSSSEDVFQYIFNNNYLEGDSLATIYASASLTKYHVKNIKKDFGEHNADLFYTLLNTGYMNPRVYLDDARAMDRMFDKLGFGNIPTGSKRTTVVTTVLNAFLFQEPDRHKCYDELNSNIGEALRRYNSGQWDLGNCDVWSHVLKYHLTRLGIETTYARGFVGKDRGPGGSGPNGGPHLWLTFVDDHGETQNIESTNMTLVSEAYFVEEQYSLVGTATLFEADGVAIRANDLLKKTDKMPLNDDLFLRYADMRAEALRGLTLDPKNFPLHIHFASLSAGMAVYDACRFHGKNKRREGAAFNQQSLEVIFSGLESMPKNESRNFMLEAALDIALSTALATADVRQLTETLFMLFQHGKRDHYGIGSSRYGWALRYVSRWIDLIGPDHHAFNKLKLHVLRALADALRENRLLLTASERTEFLDYLKTATDPDSPEHKAWLLVLEGRLDGIPDVPPDLTTPTH